MSEASKKATSSFTLNFIEQAAETDGRTNVNGVERLYIESEVVGLAKTRMKFVNGKRC